MIKSIIVVALLAVAPLSANANELTAEQENFCINIGKLSAMAATLRDTGLSASDVFGLLSDKGLNDKLAFMVVNIAYEKMPYASPDAVAGVTRVACVQAIKEQ